MSVSKAKVLETVIAFLATTPGRDKSCRTIQYFSKFLKAAFEHLSNKQNQEIFKSLSEKIDAVGGSMGMTRKVLRWGRPIGIIRNILILLKSLAKKDKSDGQNFWHTYFKILSEASLALFFLFDHVIYLGRVVPINGYLKIVKDQALVSKSDYLSNFFWLCECITTIIADCIQIHVLQIKLAQETVSRQKTAEEINEIKEKIDNSILNIIRCIIDIPIAIHFMNSKFLQPGFVGILGTITSLIGSYQSWPKK